MFRTATRSALVFSVLAAAAATNACAPIAPAAAPKGSSEWVSGPTDLRKVTAVVHVTPPARLKAQMERAAARTPDPDLADFLRGNAAGGFGSGFLVVHENASGRAAFIVTNRHVIAGSENAEVEFGDGTTYKSCDIVYASPKADLAVLALPDSAMKTFDHGLRPASVDVRERMTVIATGYPGVGGHPSFQMTEGKISNAKFSLPELGVHETSYQHTAPIDPGSSGGPLTNEAGDVVGVNVALIRGRSSMFLAVPSSDMADAVRHAHELVVQRKSAEWMKTELANACSSLAAELASKDGDVGRIDSLVSNQLVADEGIPSYLFVSTRGGPGDRVRELFFREPVIAMRTSLVVRMLLRAQLGGGATGTCGAINPSDATSITSDKPVRLAITTSSGPLELRWTFEQGSWRVAGGDLIDVVAVLEEEQQMIAQARASEASRKTAAPAKSKPAKVASKGGK